MLNYSIKGETIVFKKFCTLAVLVQKSAGIISYNLANLEKI
jgi:hypothetical protein